MSRVNMEADLRKSGRLGKVARSMKWNEREAGGALWFFYQHTQEAGIVSEQLGAIVTAIIPDFDSDEQAVAFVEAMISARLATRQEDGSILIHGNETHVKRFQEYHDRAVKGGEARQKQLREKRNDPVSNKQASGSLKQASASLNGALPSPVSILPSSSAPATSASASEGGPLSLAREAAANEYDARASIPVETTLDAIAMKIPADQAIEVVTFYRTESTSKRKLTHPPMILPREMTSARMVIAMAGGSIPIAKAIIHAYINHEGNAHWKKCGWPLAMIAQPRDFDQAQALKSQAKLVTTLGGSNG